MSLSTCSTNFSMMNALNWKSEGVYYSRKMHLITGKTVAVCGVDSRIFSFFWSRYPGIRAVSSLHGHGVDALLVIALFVFVVL